MNPSSIPHRQRPRPLEGSPLPVLTALVTLVVFAVLFSNSLAFEGFKRPVWSKAEVVDWYTEYEPHRFGYAGSDAKYHHFITRPIDSYLFIKVPREQLTIPDERPLARASSSSQLYHYEVDPKNDFKKKPTDPR